MHVTPHAIALRVVYVRVLHAEFVCTLDTTSYVAEGLGICGVVRELDLIVCATSHAYTCGLVVTHDNAPEVGVIGHLPFLNAHTSTSRSFKVATTDGKALTVEIALRLHDRSERRGTLNGAACGRVNRRKRPRASQDRARGTYLAMYLIAVFGHHSSRSRKGAVGAEHKYRRRAGRIVVDHVVYIVLTAKDVYRTGSSP